jgi:hypothetical protein
MRNSIKVCLTAAVLALGPAAAASAAVPGLELVTKGSGASSAPSHTAAAACPAGKFLLGIGGKTEGAGGQAVLDLMAPRSNNAAAIVRGHEDEDGTNQSWGVRSFAICADLPVERRQTSNEPFDSISPKLASTASGGPCPGAQRLSGVGGQILQGANGQVMLDDLVPSTDLESTLVRGAEDGNGNAGDWSLRAFALCTAPLPGLERVSVTSDLTSENKHVTARCDPGKRVIGTGGEVLGGGGEVAMQYMVPDAALTRVHVRAAEDQDGTTANWGVRAFAVCANA